MGIRGIVLVEFVGERVLILGKLLCRGSKRKILPGGFKLAICIVRSEKAFLLSMARSSVRSLCEVHFHFAIVVYLHHVRPATSPSARPRQQSQL